MKKNNTLWIILGVLVIGVLLYFFTKAPTVTPPQQNITFENITPGASLGDLITINYVLYFENGTVADTNNYDLAEKYGITNYVKGPYAFILGQSGKIPGFDEAFLGVKEGDHIEKTIEPSEAELILEVNRTRIIERMITINRKQAFPLKSFESMFKKPPVKGDIVFNDKLIFKYQVLNITEDNVITNIFAKEGEEYTLENTEWPSKIAKIAENDILLYQVPKENQSLTTPFGSAKVGLTKSRIILHYEPELHKVFNKSIELPGTGGFSLPQSFQVTNIKNDSFTIQRIGLLTDKRLKLVADIDSIIENVKEIKQTRPLVTEVKGGTEN